MGMGMGSNSRMVNVAVVVWWISRCQGPEISGFEVSVELKVGKGWKQSKK